MDAPPARRQWRIFRWRIWGYLVLLGLLAGFVAVIKPHYFTAIASPDDNGYFAQGSLLAQTGHTYITPASDAQFTGIHWLVTPYHLFVSRYPPGFSILIAATYKLAGWKAAFLINPALSILIGLFFTARRLTTTWWALTAVALLGANPMFILHAVSGWSHTASAALVIWGVFSLLRWSDTGRLRWAFLVGLLFGAILPIRYGDEIVTAGAGLFFLLHIRRVPRIWRHYAIALLGLVLPITPILIRNHLLFGSMWKTAYSLTNEQTGFSGKNFVEHGIDYLRRLNADSLGLFFALGLAGMIAMIFQKRAPLIRPLGLLLFVSSTVITLLYISYYWDPGSEYSDITLRFLLPVYPLFILSGVWTLRQITLNAAAPTPIILTALLLAYQTLWGWNQFQDESKEHDYSANCLARISQSLQDHIAPGDVVISHDYILQQLDYIHQWKLARFGLMRQDQSLPPNMMIGTDPLPFQPDKIKWLYAKYPGGPNQRAAKFYSDLFAWAGPGHKVYVVGPARDVDAWDVQNCRVETIAAIDLPPTDNGYEDDTPLDTGAQLFSIFEHRTGLPPAIRNFQGQRRLVIAELTRR